MNPVQICRFILAFCWIYQGIFPKLIHVAPLEKVITASFGFDAQISWLITKTAGVAEVLFGLTILLFYRHVGLLLLNIVALLGLLLFVAIMQTQLLIEAFNPLTTNIPMIGLGLILLLNAKQRQLSKEPNHG